MWFNFVVSLSSSSEHHDNDVCRLIGPFTCDFSYFRTVIYNLADHVRLDAIAFSFVIALVGLYTHREHMIK